jgi:hypothetical protein
MIIIKGELLIAIPAEAVKLARTVCSFMLNFYSYL